MNNNYQKPHPARWGMTKNERPFVLPNSTPICIGSKVVGYVRGQAFHKNLSASKHFLKYPPAIAFDISSLDQAEKAGAKFVVIHEKESGDVLYAPIKVIREMGFLIDRGHGSQVAFLLCQWKLKEVSKEM